MAANMPRCTQGRNCCWVNGFPCPHLRGDLCGLRAELGSWEAVHIDPRYLVTPAPLWRERGIADCGEFFCADCRGA